MFLLSSEKRYKILQKSFFSFEGWKCNFATSGHPEKLLLAYRWKIHYWPLLGKNPSGARV